MCFVPGWLALGAQHSEDRLLKPIHLKWKGHIYWHRWPRVATSLTELPTFVRYSWNFDLLRGDMHKCLDGKGDRYGAR